MMMRFVLQLSITYTLWLSGTKMSFSPKLTFLPAVLNRMGHRAVFESIRLCGHQGLALRGHRDENNTANFNCIVNLIGKFNIMVNQYLTAESKMKYLSPGIHNKY